MATDGAVPGPHPKAKKKRARPPPPTTAAPQPASFWVRLVHSATLLGYSYIIDLPAIAVLIFGLSRLDWAHRAPTTTPSPPSTDPSDDPPPPSPSPVPTFNLSADVHGLGVPSLLCVWIFFCAYTAQCTDFQRGGLRYSLVTLVVGALLLPAFYGLYRLCLHYGVDIKYTAIDMLLYLVFFTLIVLLDEKGRRILRRRLKRTAPAPPDGAAPPPPPPAPTTTTDIDVILVSCKL